MIQPCLSPAAPLPALAQRCNSPVRPAGFGAGSLRYCSARHRLLSAEQRHTVRQDKFSTVTSVNAVIQADFSRQADRESFPFGREGAARPAAVSSAQQGSLCFPSSPAPVSPLPRNSFPSREWGDATSPRQKPAAPSPPLCSQPSQIPSERSKVDRPFCFQSAWHVLWFTELINLPWAAPFNDCSINNKFPGRCLKVYRVCALSGEPRAF